MSTQPEKRVSRPRTAFSPSDKLDRPSHFLLYFDSTDSYNIALYSSINNITGNRATLNIRGKKTAATIISSGTLEFCENEQRKITRASQEAYVDNSQLEAPNFDENEDIDRFSSSQQEGLLHTFSSSNHQAISRGKRQARFQLDDESTGSISDADDNIDDDDFQLDRSTRSGIAVGAKRSLKVNKRKRKQSITSGGESKRQRTNVVHSEENPQTTDCTDRPPPTHIEKNSKDLLNEIENHMVIYQNLITKTLKRMEKKFDYHVGPNCTQNSKILDRYRTENGEHFQSEYMYGNKNLLRTQAKDIVDYGRRTLKILFSPEELKTHILPPERDHLRRPALDQERFNILLEAIRIKFRLDSDLLQQCFNDLLRSKLSNFLYEERRRESRRRIRNQERMLMKKTVQQTQDDHQENFNDGNEDTN